MESENATTAEQNEEYIQEALPSATEQQIETREERIAESHEEYGVEIDETTLADARRSKTRMKADFTRARRALLIGLSEEYTTTEIDGLCTELDERLTGALAALELLSSLYSKRGDSPNVKKMSDESEKLEDDYSSAQTRATEWITQQLQRRTPAVRPPVSRKRQSTTPQRLDDNLTSASSEDEFEQQRLSLKREKTEDKSDLSASSSPRLRPQFEPQSGAANLQAAPRASGTDVAATSSRPQSASYQLDVGADLWQQLKRVTIPTFHGDSREYEGWKAAFMSCVDRASATPEYKLLQLRQSLKGEALRTVSALGHSAAAYEAAKSRLERKYGGQRRQISRFLNEITEFRPIRQGNARDVERLTDLLDTTVVNLKDAGLSNELGRGSLYTQLQTKMTEDMLARYHRWVFESRRAETVEVLLEWLTQETEFLMMALETVHGPNRPRSGEIDLATRSRNNPGKTFFTKQSVRSSSSTDRNQCVVCQQSGHAGAWACQDFKSMEVDERWVMARKLNLCFRCLGRNHHGNGCRRSRTCGLNGCGKNHHRLLHQDVSVSKSDGQGRSDEQCQQPSNEREGGGRTMTAFDHEDENELDGTSLTTQAQSEFIALRTVPVILSNGTRSVKVNALLDDGSTRTYVNRDVVEHLRLNGTQKEVNVSALIGQMETFQSMYVEFDLHSCNGNVHKRVSAMTTERVTGDMKVVDWQAMKGKKQWEHLQSVRFPKVAKQPTVDILIGLDHAEFHQCHKELRGQPGEPVARLTPLGWTCVGPVGNDYINLIVDRVHHALTNDTNMILRRFWEVENVPMNEQTELSYNDREVLEKAKRSMKHNGERYEVTFPWKEEVDKPRTTSNYKMAENRLGSTIRRLECQPEVAKSCPEMIKQYEEKGYIRKVGADERKAGKWYLPHFPIVKPDKTTTKVRIVFDASAKHHGVSLNDQVQQGPKLQRDLTAVLLRFRRYPVCLISDIKEMYLQIQLSTSDRPYHRFLWQTPGNSNVAISCATGG